MRLQKISSYPPGWKGHAYTPTAQAAVDQGLARFNIKDQPIKSACASATCVNGLGYTAAVGGGNFFHQQQLG
jgi:hypothetical protein